MATKVITLHHLRNEENYNGMYGQQDAASTFNLYGQVVLPHGRDYSSIPPETCVHIRVQENIQCSEICDIPVLGSAVIRDFKVVHDKIRYNVTVNRTAVGLYAVSATLNVQCREDGSYHAGDYLNTFSFTFDVPFSVMVKEFDVELDCPDESKDHFLKRATTTTPTTTTAVPATKKVPTGRPAKLIEDFHIIQGFLKLPNKGDWNSLAHLSCMQVHLYPVDFVCTEGHCPQHILFSTRAMVTDVTEYKVEYHLKVFNLAKGKYLIRATLNVGWCNSNTAAKDWLHEGDYYTKAQHQLDLNEADENKVVHRDIDVVAHKKYHCGGEKCYLTENCEFNQSKQKKHCVCRPRACPDMMKPEWVCANNGKTYASKCWMQMSDCFSGTVYAVKKGKCDDHYGGRRGHHGGRHGRRHGHRHHGHMRRSVKIAMYAIAGVIFLLIVLSVAIVIRKYTIRKKAAKQSYSKFENMRSSSLSFSVPNDEKKTPENFYVTDPVKYIPSSDREITKNAVYLEKVDYAGCETGGEAEA